VNVFLFRPLPGKDQEDPDNGKPAATPGRKASGLGGKVAGLPKDDGSMEKRPISTRALRNLQIPPPPGSPPAARPRARKSEENASVCV